MLPFHTHALEIKTCLTSARARLTAKSRAGRTRRCGCGALPQPPACPPCATPSCPRPSAGGAMPVRTSGAPAPAGFAGPQGPLVPARCCAPARPRSFRAREGAAVSVCGSSTAGKWQESPESSLRERRCSNKNTEIWLLAFSPVSRWSVKRWSLFSPGRLRESRAEKRRLLLSPSLRGPAWLQLPFAFRNPSPVRGRAFPNVAGLEAANEKHSLPRAPGEKPPERGTSLENNSISAQTARC